MSRDRGAGLPLWPLVCLASLGTALCTLAYSLTRLARVIDDAHNDLDGDDQ